MDKLIRKYIHIACYSNKKRLAKKAWTRAVELATDNDGMVNYAKLARLVATHKNHRSFLRWGV